MKQESLKHPVSCSNKKIWKPQSRCYLWYQRSVELKKTEFQRQLWNMDGGKLHISVVDGDIPITAIYSGANVHDSSVALPLINETSKKVSYLYDLQDAGYDSNIIRDFSKKLNHRPLIDINPKNSKELKKKFNL